ncbi:MAG: hypothetical protein ABW148_14330 [Sedimenticola sp.]
MNAAVIVWEVAFYAIRIAILVPVFPYLALIGVGFGMGFDSGWNIATGVYAIILTSVMAPLALLFILPLTMIIRYQRFFKYWFLWVVVLVVVSTGWYNIEKNG